MDGLWETILWINNYLVAPALYVLAGVTVVYSLILGFRPGHLREVGLKLSGILIPAVCILLAVNLLPFVGRVTYEAWKEASEPGYAISFGDSPSRTAGRVALPVVWRASERYETQVNAFGIAMVSSDKNQVRVQWALIWVALCSAVALWWSKGRRSPWIVGSAALGVLLPLIMTLCAAAFPVYDRGDAPMTGLLRFGVAPAVIILASAIGFAGLLGVRQSDGKAVGAALVPAFRWVATFGAGFGWAIVAVIVVLAESMESRIWMAILIPLILISIPVVALWIRPIRCSPAWTAVMVMATTPLLWPVFWEVFQSGW